MTDMFVIVCRSGREPLTPGSKRGYQCAYCNEPLQVTAHALERIEHHKERTARLLCNPCGIRFTVLAEEMGKLEGVEIGPAGKEFMDSDRSKGNAFADWVREQMRKEN